MNTATRTAPSAPRRYNPAPIRTVYRIAVFNRSGHGVAEFATAPGLLLDFRKTVCQNIADQVPEGYTVQVFDGIYTIGRTSGNSRTIVWE